MNPNNPGADSPAVHRETYDRIIAAGDAHDHRLWDHYHVEMATYARYWLDRALAAEQRVTDALSWLNPADGPLDPLAAVENALAALLQDDTGTSPAPDPALTRIERKIDMLLRSGPGITRLAGWLDDGPVDLERLPR